MTLPNTNSRYFSSNYDCLLRSDTLSRNEIGDVFKLVKDEFRDNSHYALRSVQPYPLIISRARKEAIKNALVQMPKIWDSALRSFSDGKKCAEYFEVPESLFDSYLKNPPSLDTLMTRHDLFFTQGQPVFLEVNAGSRVGGWDHDLISHEILKVVAQLDLGIEQNIKYQPVVFSFFMEMAKAVSTLSKRSETVNILLYNTIDPESSVKFRPMLLSIVRNVPLFANCELLLCQDLDELSFDHDNTAYFQGKQLHLVMLPELVDNQTAIDNLVRSHKKGTLLFVDHPIYLLFGSKAFLALVHEEFVQKNLDSEQKRWVDLHIPWTIKLPQETVQWCGQTLSTSELLDNFKDDLVLKAANGFSGREVVIGKFCSALEWRSEVRKVINNSQWIVQKYSAPDQEMAINDKGEVSLYTPVWGVFAVGKNYAGSMIRAFESSLGEGIINASNGACELVIFEDFD